MNFLTSVMSLNRCFFVLLALSLSQIAHAGCEDPYAPLNLADMNGLNSKWRTYSKRLRVECEGVGSSKDTRVTIQPDLGGLNPVQWLNQTAEIGATPDGKPVNRLMLNLDPARLYLAEDDARVLSRNHWDKYIRLSFKNRLNLSQSEKDFLAELQPVIDQNLFTVRQRNSLLLAFLIALETGYGGICSDRPLVGRIERRIPFILHQRKYVNRDPGSVNEDEFAAEMSQFINRVKLYDKWNGTSLVKWIAGIRLGENMSPDPAQWKQSVLRIAQQLNLSTGDFLKEREFIANGPIMGSDYRVKTTSSNGLSYDISINDSIGAKNDLSFIKQISLETNSFAIGYKFIVYDAGMAEHMESFPRFSCADGSLLGPARPCDRNSVTDWKSVLDQKGFADLKAYVNRHYKDYPRHSNVVWVGDSGDAMKSFLEVVSSETGEEFRAGPSYVAIAQKFFYAPNYTNGILNRNFHGKMFMQPNSSDVDFENRESSVVERDSGKYLLFMHGAGIFGQTPGTSPLDWVPVEGHLKELNTKSLEIWKQWPSIPNEVRPPSSL